MILPHAFSILYSFVRFLLEILLVRTSSEARLRAEVLALRHQLRVLERQVKRPDWQQSDRLLLTALSRALPARVGNPCCPAPRPSSAGIVSWSGDGGPPTLSDLVVRRLLPVSFTNSSFVWPGRIRAGAIGESKVSF